VEKGIAGQAEETEAVGIEIEMEKVTDEGIREVLAQDVSQVDVWSPFEPNKPSTDIGNVCSCR
jgi:hypothetical protein